MGAIRREIGRQGERKVKRFIFFHALPALTCMAASFQESAHDPGLLVLVRQRGLLLYYLGADLGHQ